SLGQLIQTTSPDEGEARFVYRKDGQVRFSRNSKQKANKEFSHTNYDALGRPVESGVYYGTDLNPETYANMANTDYYGWFSDALLALADEQDGLDDAYGKEQHFTLYDVPDESLDDELQLCGFPTEGYRQTFLYGNVSRSSTANPYTTTTWYSYDVYGRVKWLVQQTQGLDCFQTIHYSYDPITGQVAKVDYQRDVKSQRFVHAYEYNVAGQLVKASTSRDDENYVVNAEYFYNMDGSLKRTELGEDLQGIDYVYNLNGQLKAINSPHSTGFTDPGNDSPLTTGFKPDVFGMVIDYHASDYGRGKTQANSDKWGLSGIPVNSPYGQLNGNIGSIRWANDTPVSNSDVDTYGYLYNKNSWLAQARYGKTDLEEEEFVDLN